MTGSSLLILSMSIRTSPSVSMRIAFVRGASSSVGWCYVYACVGSVTSWCAGLLTVDEASGPVFL